MSSITEQSLSNLIPLKEGQALIVEPGAMLAYQNCTIQTMLTTGSIWKKFKTYFLGGETVFENKFTANKNGGWIALEENLHGQIASKNLLPKEPPLMIRRSAYLASTPNVHFNVKYLGISGYMKGQGIASLGTYVNENEGKVWFHAQEGVVRSFEVHQETGPIIVDNDMILAYSGTLESTLRKMGGIFSSIFSGEGLVCEFKGDGVVYVSSGSQTGSDNLFTLSMKETAERISLYISNIISITITSSILGGLFYYYTGRNPIEIVTKFALAYMITKIPLVDEILKKTRT